MSYPTFGFVYLLQCGGHYKIGFSDKPRKRMKQMRTGSPYPIYLVHSLRTMFYRQIEKQLHRRFAEKRVRGEWFVLDDEDVAYIVSLNKNGRTPEEEAERQAREAAYFAKRQAESNARARAEAQAAMLVVAAV